MRLPAISLLAIGLASPALAVENEAAIAAAYNVRYAQVGTMGIFVVPNDTDYWRDMMEGVCKVLVNKEEMIFIVELGEYLRANENFRDVRHYAIKTCPKAEGSARP